RRTSVHGVRRRLGRRAGAVLLRPLGAEEVDAVRHDSDLEDVLLGTLGAVELALQPALDRQLRAPALILGNRARGRSPHLDGDVVRGPTLPILSGSQIL